MIFATNAAALTLRSTPDPGPLVAGQLFNVVVEVGTQKDPAAGIFAVGLQLEFDRFAFVPVSHQVGGFFGENPTLEFTRPELLAGSYAHSRTLLEGQGIDGHGTLVTFRLQVLPGAGEGEYTFPLTRVDVVDAFGDDIDFEIELGSTNVSGQPRGACCLPGGECVLTTAEACAQQEGTYEGDGTVCENVACAGALGACCVESMCTVTTRDECAQAGGDYLGEGTDCSGDPCAQGFGSLFVDSNPQGAAITLDGDLIGQVTPYRFDQLLPGTHCVAWTRPGFGGCGAIDLNCTGREFEVVAGDTTNAFCAMSSFNVRLVPGRARLFPSELLYGFVRRASCLVTVPFENAAVARSVIPSVAYLGEHPFAPEDWSFQGTGSAQFHLDATHLIIAAELQEGAPLAGRSVTLPLRFLTEDDEWLEVPILVSFRPAAIRLETTGSLATHVLPNPFRDQSIITWDARGEASTVVIADAAGRQVGRFEVPSSRAGVLVWDGRIDGTALPNGIYLYSVSSGDRRGSGRLLLLKR